MHLLVRAQLVKTVANGLRRHALQPEALHGFAQRNGLTRLLRAGILLYQTENKLALTPRIAGVDQGVHVFALGLLHHRVQARFGLVHGLEVEIGRDNRQVGKAPLAAFHVKFLRGLNFHQVAHRAGDHIGFTFKVILVFLKFTCDRR